MPQYASKHNSRNVGAIAKEIVDRVRNGAMVSYAQNGEDVILRRVFKERQTGFYVDVGAFHPCLKSVTFHFHLEGWKGMNIDVDADNMATFSEERPDDINLCHAMGSNNDEVTFFLIPGSSRGTSMSQLAESYSERGFDVKKQTMVKHTLDQVFIEHGISEVDFLKIDVEGAEQDVLMGCTFDTVRPIVVLLEATYPETSEQNHGEWESILTNKQYHFATFDGLNRYYVRDENKELLPRFEAPPSYFDNFVTHNSLLMAEAILSQGKTV